MHISIPHSPMFAMQVALHVLNHHLGPNSRLVDHFDVRSGNEDWFVVEARVGDRRFVVEVSTRTDADFEYPVKLSQDGRFVRCYFFFHSDARDLFPMPDGLSLEECQGR